MDQFEAFFKSADLDGDGRISGAEAVTFFQGSNLPKNVLAQIWMHADQRQTGFLGRPEFYNALRLVTVAQTKRELTPEIVKAALYGPAAAKIPPPKINLPAKPAPYSSQPPVASAGQMAPPALPPSQAPNASQNQQYFPPQQSQTPRPPQSMPLAPSVRPPQPNSAPQFPRGDSMLGSGVPSAGISNNWASGMSGGAPSGLGGMNQVLTAPVRPQSSVSLPLQTMVSDSRALVVPGNGPTPASGFGNDLFSAGPSPPKLEPSGPSSSVNSIATTPPASGGSQTSDKPNSLDSLTSFLRGPSSGQPPRTQTSASPSLQVSSQVSAPTSFAAPASTAAAGTTTSNSSQIPWPKMKPADVQKYTKVFMEVDTDRDGKIMGDQARNLFLSWRLPREILKQVWDLSDQDNDSMLSLREFCFALYLMERFREGRPLPSALPSNVMYDETLLSMTGPPKFPHGNAAWGPTTGPGFGPQQGMPGARPVAPVTGPRPPRPPMQFPQADSAVKSGQRDLNAPVLGDSFLNQTDGSDQADATTTEKKHEEKIILDSKEKLEFYRTKMQDLVLYKSRCDNKLNEITERAIADKREAELLAKKYEEKYKQVAEIASKLTVEEATFRDIQERKMELQQAIVKMEQGGSADGILQVRADRVQSDLDELMKGLVDRCRKHGIDVKPAALIVLPAGWQPGIPEGAAVWDEDWDKFEDEGFGNELSFDGKKSTSAERQAASPDNSSPTDSFSNADGKHSSPFSGVEQAFDSESMYNHSEDGSGRSPRGSPLGRPTPESPSQVFSDPHFEKSSEGDAETHRSFDDSNWGTFDNNDDVDSVWGFNTKDSTSYSFGDSDFGVKPIKTGSPPSANNVFQARSPFFEDSVPPSPASKFGNNSPRYSEAGDSYFDNFSRFDSFRTTSDSGGLFSSQPDRLTRFDSVSSSKDFPQSDKFTRFDSISSSKDTGTLGRGFSSFDDSDPFGASGPFKVSSETPKKSSDNWNAF